MVIKTTALLFIFTMAFLLIVPWPGLHAQGTRNFALPEGVITDFTGTLTEPQVDEIRRALQASYESNSMDGHVIINLSTEEWHLEEYAKDYADFLQGRGLINASGWLLYISTADRKFAFVVQDRALKAITEARKAEIELILSEKLEQDDMYGGILDAVNAISALQAPEIIQGKRNMSPDMLIFMGIVVMIIALMLRLRNTQKKSLIPGS